MKRGARRGAVLQSLSTRIEEMSLLGFLRNVVMWEPARPMPPLRPATNLKAIRNRGLYLLMALALHAVPTLSQATSTMVVRYYDTPSGAVRYDYYAELLQHGTEAYRGRLWSLPDREIHDTDEFGALERDGHSRRNHQRHVEQYRPSGSQRKDDPDPDPRGPRRARLPRLSDTRRPPGRIQSGPHTGSATPIRHGTGGELGRHQDTRTQPAAPHHRHALRESIPDAGGRAV